MRHAGYDGTMTAEEWGDHILVTKWYGELDVTWEDLDEPGFEWRPIPAVDERCHDCGKEITRATSDYALLDGRTLWLCHDCYHARCEAGQYLCTYCRCEFTKRTLPERFCGDVMCEPCMRVTEKLLNDLSGTVAISYEPKAMN